MPIWSMLFSQNSNSPIMENLMFFHDHMLVVLTTIMVSTFLMGILSINQKFNFRLSKEIQEMEIFWSFLPSVILFMIAIPSMKLLYLMEESFIYSMTVKIIGHQWYWSYEYSDFEKMSFDSFLSKKSPRNLNCTRHLSLPSETPIRFLVTSTDVIHSWTVPVVGSKMDAVPGRTNQFHSIFLRPGVFFGQCSEICGMQHSFMPISVSTQPKSDFINSMNEAMMKV